MTGGGSLGGRGRWGGGKLRGVAGVVGGGGR